MNGAGEAMIDKPVALTAALRGTSLIEASAGTGKTWTLSGLFLRLIVEKGLGIEQILTVTFTRAATAELRERIRRRLQEMADTLAGGAGDLFCQELARRLPDRELAGRRLAAALTAFDDVPVYTIHGFCQRALADRAFSSGMPFRSDILADSRAALQTVVEDFWRREIAGPGTVIPPEVHAQFVAWLLHKPVSPASLTAWATRMLSRQGVLIDAPQVAGDAAGALSELNALHTRLAALWREQSTAILHGLTDSPHLKRTVYKPKSLPQWQAEMEGYFAAAADATRRPDCFEKFTARVLAGSVKTGGVAPAHDFFDLADALPALAQRVAEAFEALLGGLRAHLLEHARGELGRRLKHDRLQAYDDLLRNLDGALSAPGGEALARVLRERYPAALIDEFQDTDPLQYRIFSRIYGGAGEPSALFLVGDPKQAIYSFRGADLFAYLAAVTACEQRYTLDVNQRSVPPLVRALNTLFNGAVRPFRFEAIAYRAVTPANRERQFLVEEGAPDPAPLRFVMAPPGEDGGVLGKAAARDWAAGAAAAEIARLLAAAREGRVRLGEEPLQARHIAVLVNNHEQAAAVRRALRALGLGCAEQSRDSVFHAVEAEEIERLLLAVAEPQREALCRAALTGLFFGLDGAALIRLDNDETQWQARLLSFRRYHELWRDRGLMPMLRQLMREEETVGRLARRTGGARALTNLFHLAELLHAQAERLPGMEALTGWLAARRAQAGDDEEAQLRLESDEDLVQVLTIHRSKGLEYPVAFCPFLWDGKSHIARDKEFFYHDPRRAQAAVLDLGSARAAEAQRLAREEELAERLRLAYVALTRACNRCYVMWGRIKQAEASPLGWLLHQLEGEQAALPGASELIGRLGELSAASGGALRAEAIDMAGPPPADERPGAAALMVRTPVRRPPAPWGLSSFSSLRQAGGGEWAADSPDHDQRLPRAPARGAPGGGRFDFPRGAEAGICLHAILESIDFAAQPAAWTGAIAAALRRAGLPETWRDELSTWLHAVMTAPLRAGLTLSRLARRTTAREMEFHLVLQHANARRLGERAGAYGLAVPSLPPARLNGYLKGFIDLVFVHEGRYYLADYKSNWLGDSFAGYEPAALEDAMAREGYVLQYLLYSVALHRWLGRRLPGYDYARHFGGAFYLFLRGMAPASGEAARCSPGVFFARPEQALIEELDALLGGLARSAGGGP